MIVQADSFNRSRLGTVVVVGVTSNLSRAGVPGNVRLAKGAAGLTKASVVNVAHLVAIDRSRLVERIGKLPADPMQLVDAGLRAVLALV